LTSEGGHAAGKLRRHRGEPEAARRDADIATVLLAIHSRMGLVGFHADAVAYGLSEWQDLPAADRTTQADAYRRVLTSAEPAGLLPALSTWETWRPAGPKATCSEAC
jgi:muramoyltetrapeptide carboxypeptidase